MAYRSPFFAEFEDDEGLPDMRRGLPMRPGVPLDMPTSEERLDNILGIEPPTEDEFEEAEFEVSPFDRFRELVANSGGLQVAPQGFGQSLAAGLVRGLGAQGQRVGERRQKFEQGQARRAALRDQANIQATRDYRQARAQSLRDLSKEERERNANTRRITAKDIEQYPGLAGFAPNERIPLGTYERLGPGSVKAPAKPGDLEMMTPDQRIEYERKRAQATQGPEALVAIETPDGPRLVPRSQAVGKAPAKEGGKAAKPSAAEREALIGDIGMLDQIGRARDLFRPHLVGPASGRYGAVTQAVGVGKRQGEAPFRASIAGIRNQILKLRSGGAVSDGEAARLLQELPTEQDPSDVWQAKMDAFETTYRTLAQTRREVLGSTGVDLGGVNDLPPSRSSAAKEYAEYLKLRGGR